MGPFLGSFCRLFWPRRGAGPSAWWRSLLSCASWDSVREFAKSPDLATFFTFLTSFSAKTRQFRQPLSPEALVFFLTRSSMPRVTWRKAGTGSHGKGMTSLCWLTAANTPFFFNSPARRAHGARQLVRLLSRGGEAHSQEAMSQASARNPYPSGESCQSGRAQHPRIPPRSVLRAFHRHL